MNYGKDYGRLVVIVDVVDQNRVITTDAKRIALNMCVLMPILRFCWSTCRRVVFFRDVLVKL